MQHGKDYRGVVPRGRLWTRGVLVLSTLALTLGVLPLASGASSKVASNTTVTQGIVGVAPAYVFPVGPAQRPHVGHELRALQLDHVSPALSVHQHGDRRRQQPR